MPEPKPARAAVAVATNNINNNNGTYTPTNNPFHVPVGEQLNFACTPSGTCWVYFEDPGWFTPSAPNPLLISTAPTQALSPSGNPTETGYAIVPPPGPPINPGTYPYKIKVGLGIP